MRGIADDQQVVVDSVVGVGLESDTGLFLPAAGDLLCAEVAGPGRAALTWANCCPPTLLGGKSTAYLAPKALTFLNVASVV